VQHQLVTLGEAMLRLSVRPDERIEDAAAFEVHVGGSEANVAYAAARVGLKSAWVSALPDNPLGHRVASTLGAAGVHTSLVRWVPNARLGLYFVELASAPRPISVTYDRAGSAMARASVDDFDWSRVADTEFLHVSGITFGLSASCAEMALRAMSAARKSGARVTFDVNYRQKLWGVEAAEAAGRVAASMADVVICTSEDARDLFRVKGGGEEAATRLRAELGVETVVLTLGTEGAVAVGGSGAIARPGHRVDTVDRVGAGDAFTAGLLWGLVDGSLELGLERGLAMSALKMGLRGDLFRFDASEVNALLAREGREVGR